MDRKFVATLACRIVGIYILLQALYPLTSVLAAIPSILRGDRSGLSEEFQAAVIMSTLLVVGGGVLLCAPAFVARRIAGEPSAAESDAVSARALELIAYRALGVFAIIGFGPQLLGEIAAQLSSPELRANGLGQYQVQSLASGGVGLAIGLWLLFGARGLAGLVDRARGVGLLEEERGWKSKAP